MWKQHGRDLLIGIICVLLQVSIFRHLRIFGTSADIVLIYLLWIMTVRDRTTAIWTAATLGLLQDALLDLWGLNMFAKVAIAFFGYNMMPKQSGSRLLTGQIFLMVLMFSIAHNLLFLLAASFIESYAIESLFWYMLLIGSLYTAITASIVHLFRTP